MIDVGGAEVAADDIADECEVLAPDRLIKTERDCCGVNILGRSCFDVDDVEDRIADAVDADKADQRHGDEKQEGLAQPSQCN